MQRFGRAGQQTNTNQQISLRNFWSSSTSSWISRGSCWRLPLTFQATCLVTLTFIGRCACCPDCVGSCTQLMRCHMCHCRSLSGCKSRFPRRSAHHSGCRHGVTGGISGMRHCDLASRPSARQFNIRMSRTIIAGLHVFKEVQHVLRAISCPYRKQMMIGVLESTAATHIDKPGVSLLW